jgi:hypothetical protein
MGIGEERNQMLSAERWIVKSAGKKETQRGSHLKQVMMLVKKKKAERGVDGIGYKFPHDHAITSQLVGIFVKILFSIEFVPAY